MAVAGTSLSIDIRAGGWNRPNGPKAPRLGLRVLIGGRQACVSASDTSAAHADRLAERAVAMAREAPEDPYAGLADPARLARELGSGGAGTVRRRARTRVPPRWRPTPAAPKPPRWPRPGITQVEASAGYGRRQRASGRHQRLFAAAMRAPRGRSPPWPSPATAPGWSATGPAKAASIRPTCPRPRSIGALAAERALARAGRAQAQDRHLPGAVMTNASPPR